MIFCFFPERQQNGEEKKKKKADTTYIGVTDFLDRGAKPPAFQKAKAPRCSAAQLLLGPTPTVTSASGIHLVELQSKGMLRRKKNLQPTAQLKSATFLI